ncbi:glycoside hydrolase [Acidovorax sp. sif1233]|uniref:sialidase family protein n=1 Tax=Acidovorax sp. sif1233 TaxID=2854792 RepID=UPI001C4463C3|nr:sialidase family protein [Acidovorax sp. sif1233]MBV7457309.1 glycoside hydrolase [Acidovorax sp. sif1233]
MLIFDDSKGTSDGKEKDQLQAMVAVGSEFMTYRDSESTVQRSGEFVRIEKETSDPQPRFLLVHETSQTYTDKGQDLTGNELLNLTPNSKLRKRSRLYMSEIDPLSGDLPFREIGGFKAQTRISRHHGFTTQSAPRSYDALGETNYTAQAGKRRLFPKGDGKVLLVREVVIPGDARYFNDSMRAIVSTPQPHTKKRGLRAARVEVVELNPTVGTTSAPVFSFDVHSGLSFDPVPRSFSNSIRATADMFNDNNVFAAFSGVMFGSTLESPSVARVPPGGDASDTYAVCEPGVAKTADGREYTSIIAVYPAPDDVYDPRSAGPYRLTFKRTTPEGGVALGKINFPPVAGRPQHYLAARGMSLHRLGPSTVVLRVNVHAMQFGAGGSIFPSASDAFFMWSTNNGESWTYVAPALNFLGVFPYGGMLVKDKNTLLAFSFFQQFGAEQVEVHRITISGTAKIGSIPGATFSSGLMTPGSGQLLVPYVPVGFGGATYLKTTEGKKKRLWMQFDPYWAYKDGMAQVLEYPGSRPMLLVSDDGGLTWARRLLPTPWSFRAGFVVSIDEGTLAVPVYAARKEPGASLRATVYTSKNGGDTWKASDAQVGLPGDTWVDGQVVVGAQYWHPIANEYRFEQDLSDSALQYNRGELLPLVALRDSDGKILPSNPARPWMAHHQFKEPAYV